MKKMHLKNKKKYYYFIIYILIIIISYFISLKFILNSSLKEKEYMELISDIPFSKNTKYTFVIKESFKILSSNTINDQYTYLDNIYKLKEKNKIIKEVPKKEKIVPKEEIKPSLYIYNTHQHEKYVENEKGVIDASNLLKEKLKNYNIESVVENESVEDFINTSGVTYNKYYGTTRIFINNAKEKYSSIKFFIDLHRDGIEKDASTININGKDYAKILFVIASSNPNYLDNENEANNISERINKDYNGLSRGVFERDDGNPILYNQDISKYVFLIEIGGNYNTYNEVSNTIDVISKYISEYIKENS